MSTNTPKNTRRQVGILNATKIATSANFAFTAGATNVAEVAISLKDKYGNVIAEPRMFDIYLSDSAVGTGVTATSASGTVTAKSASGVVIGTLTSKKALRVQALATGIFTLEITDTGKTAFYVVVVNPVTGENMVSRVMTTADYGA